MIDQDDVDDVFLVAALSPGVLGVVLILLALVMMCVASDNETECAARRCPAGQTPKLMEHDCLCTMHAE